MLLVVTCLCCLRFVNTKSKMSSNIAAKTVENSYISPQCQYFVIRKKRLCRMTVKPGKHYCGEHEPQPKTGDGQDDTRIPCPNDPKHTCYASKLEKHLSICNARQLEQPDYIVHNVNSPAVNEDCPRVPLSKIPLKSILQVIGKVNVLYDTYIKDKITTLAEQPIHRAVLPEFCEAGRTESSLRHLRQASSLLRVVESEGLVADNTAYVELGAGKGHLSYYAWYAWCQASNSQVLLIDRASLRHKRDNKLKITRNLHTDQLSNSNNSDKISHSKQNTNKRSHTNELNLHNTDDNDSKCDSNVHRIRADLAHLLLELVPAVQACDRVVGYAKHLCGVATDLALRCITAASVAAKVRGVVVASCCHHRCERAAYPANAILQKLGIDADDFNTLLGIVSWATCGDGRSRDRRDRDRNTQDTCKPDQNNTETHDIESPDQNKMELHGDDNPGMNNNNPTQTTKSDNPIQISNQENLKPSELNVNDSPENKTEINHTDSIENRDKFDPKEANSQNIATHCSNEYNETELGTKNLDLSREQREVIGRRAKALLDWGRVLHLKERGFDARLVHYVPTSVSLENVCIVASKLV